MSPEPSELIAAFVSKVPFFRGLGSGVGICTTCLVLRLRRLTCLFIQIHRYLSSNIAGYISGKIGRHAKTGELLNLEVGILYTLHISIWKNKFLRSETESLNIVWSSKF